MRLFIFIICLIVAVGCTDAEQASSKNAAQSIDSVGVSVTIQDIGSGQWSAEYVFATPRKTMFFSRSNGNYRVGSWIAETPGVVFENLNGFDTMSFEEPLQNVRFTFQPHTEDIPKDYTPFIPFTDGGLAVFTGQFDVMPADNREAVLALNGDISKWKGEQPELAVRVMSEKALIKDGKILSGKVIDKSFGGGNYIYIGEAEITTGQDFSGVIDPGLPEWISKRFDRDLTNIFEGHRQLWNEGLPQKTTVLFAFRGYEGQGFSNNGGAIGNLLSLETKGQSLKTKTDGILAHFHWFFAHEAAHLFQNRTGKTLENGNVAWISEGAANAMAYMVMQKQALATDAYFLQQYQNEIKHCVGYLEEARLQDAANSGRYDALYSCGNLIAIITAASLPEHSLFDFWNVLLSSPDDETKFGAESYFTTMKQLGASEAIIEGLRNVTTQKIDDPTDTLTGLMQSSGLAITFDPSGKLASIQLP